MADLNAMAQGKWTRLVTVLLRNGWGDPCGAMVLKSIARLGLLQNLRSVPATQTVPLPRNVPMEQAACLGIPGITAHRAVHVTGPVGGRTILVQGFGGSVGLCAVQLACRSGAHVIGTIRTAAEEQTARQAGAHEVLLNDAELPVRLRTLAPEGIDHIVEVAFAANIERDVELLKSGGSIATYATNAATPTIPFWQMAKTSLPQVQSTASFNAANELIQRAGVPFTYDANGNITNDGVHSYSWNTRNQLVAIDSGGAASFSYDALGRRTSKAIAGLGTTSFLYDGLNVIQELNGASPTPNLLTGGTDEYFTRTDANGTVSFLSDVLGSTVALTDATGAVQTQYIYDPFGATTITGAATTNSFGFAGRENDTAGLYYYRARYYNPNLNRFGGNAQNRIDIWRQWRSKWIEEGMHWFSVGSPRPKDWDPVAQVGRIQGAGE